MRNEAYPILVCCALIMTMLACNFSSAVPTLDGQGGNILTQAVQTLPAQIPTANSGISVEAALTLAIETLQAQATPTNTDAPSNPPISKPKKTKVPKPSNTPSLHRECQFWRGELELGIFAGSLFGRNDYRRKS